MADIDIQRKGPSIWPWILGLLVLGLLAWFLFGGTDDEGDVTEVEPAAAPVTAPAEPTDDAAAAMPAPVSEYMTACTQPLPADAEMGRQHEFTAQCLRSLAASIESVVQRDQLAGTDVPQRLQTLRQQAQTLEQADPQAATHAATTREAFTAAADLIEATYQSGYSSVSGLGDQVSRLRSAAQAVSADRAMLDQRDAVHSFFREAGEAIRRIAETPASRG